MNSCSVKRENESPDKSRRKNVKKATKHVMMAARYTVNEMGKLQPVSVKPSTSCVVSDTEIRAFFSLLDNDCVINNFLRRDSCCKVADKYLLAMVFAYFKRAKLPPRRFSRINFFIALYLANDLEEDDEEEKHMILYWALGDGWRWRAPKFLHKRDQLWAKMNYRAIVSLKTCEEYIALAPNHTVWQRTRLPHHAGAFRYYGLNCAEKPGVLFGPSVSPPDCPLCYPNSASPNSSFSSIFSTMASKDFVDDDGNMFAIGDEASRNVPVEE